MRVGIMLRSLDEKFGIGIYTRNILDALLKLNRGHQYILFYNNREHVGKHGHYANVEERVVTAPHKLLWDQVAVVSAASQAKVDVLFHPKFTVPLRARCKTVMVLHGASWFTHPELYPNKLDLAYVKTVMPLYCRRADAMIANSKLTTDDFVDILRVPREKIRTVYHGINPMFKPIRDPKTLDEAKRRYNLPERFILTVSRYDRRKNFSTLFNAFTQCRAAGNLKLVAVGKDSWKYKRDCRMVERGYEEDVIFPGYVEQEDLPALYTLAEVFIFPSVYEEFGIPLLEAMACGCPVVASNTGAIPEITDGAAFLADTFDADAMAQGIDKLTYEADFRQTLVAKGLHRAGQFKWEKTAAETLETLERAALQ
jgi:glycosyltransferase involved in cell wall biosynthesis